MAGELKLTFQIMGAKRLVRVFERADLEARARVAAALRVTAEEVAQGARMRVPVRTGELWRTIRATPTSSPFRWIVSAGFGTLKRRSRRKSTSTRRRRPVARMLGPIEPGIYAMVVEFGSQSGRAKQPAQPYMYPALVASRERHIARITTALNGAAEVAARAA